MDKLLTTTEVAKVLGVSRVAIFKRIKKGELPAKKIGRAYLVNEKDIAIGRALSKNDEKIIDRAVDKVVKEYGETLRMLGKE